MNHLFRKLWWHDEGQDIAEYAVMLPVVLVLVVGAIRLVEAMRTPYFHLQPAQFNEPTLHKRERSPRPMDKIVLIMFASAISTMTALSFIELRPHPQETGIQSGRSHLP